jgi:uncharacterized protein
MGMAIFETHKPREDVGSPPSAAYQDVAFESDDGLKLRGWYRPSRNGAAVLLAHGGGGDRTGALRQARILDRHGYGVLLFDFRGRGESEGSPNGWGWGWEKDAAGALDFLGTRPDIEDGRIGGLGLSSGADTLIDVAATRDDVRAVVADGAVARTHEDMNNISGGGGAFDAVPGWLMFKGVEATTGEKPSVALEDLVPRIEAPLLLISAGTKVERDANERFVPLATAPVTHWNEPSGKHTGLARSHPREYEERVTAFLDAELLGR